MTLLTILRPPVAGGTTLSPSGLPRTRAQGNPVVSPQVKPAALAHTRAQGAPKVNPQTRPAGQAHSRTLGTTAVAVRISPTGLAHTRAQGAPRVNPKLAPGGLTHTRAQGTITVTVGFFLTPASLTHTRTQGNSAVSPQLRPASLTHTRALGTPALTTPSVRQLGGLIVTVAWVPRPTGLEHTRLQGDPTTHGRATITVTGLDHGRSQGTPTLSARTTPTGLVHTRTQGAASVNPQTASPPSLVRRYGVDFDGTTAYLQATDSTSLRIETNNAFSWALWARLDSYNNNVLPRFWEKRSHYVALMGDSTNGKYRQVALELADSGGVAHEYWGRIDLNTGVWTHIAGTYDGATDTCRQWINGIEDTVDEIHPGGPFGGTLQSTTGINFFLARRRTDLLRNLDGAMADFRLWNRALTPAEIVAAYNGTVASSGLVADWDLDEGTGTTATDDSGNTNTGTLTNPAWLTGRSQGTPTATITRIIRHDGLEHTRAVGAPTAHGFTELGPASLTRNRLQGTLVLSGRALPGSLVHTRAQGAPAVNVRQLAPLAISRA